MRGASLARDNGLEMNDVPFLGSGPETLAVLGGKIDVAIVSVASCKAFLDAGTLRMLALQHPTRLKSIPNVPTFKEQGQDIGFPIHAQSYFAPKGTPENRIKILRDAIKRTTEDTPFQEAMTKAGIDVLYGSAQDISNDTEQMRKVYGDLFKSLGLQ